MECGSHLRHCRPKRLRQHLYLSYSEIQEVIAQQTGGTPRDGLSGMQMAVGHLARRQQNSAPGSTLRLSYSTAVTPMAATSPMMARAGTASRRSATITTDVSGTSGEWR